jgi:hypothetical protein
MQRWEYLTIFVKADAKREEAFLRELRDWKDGMPIHTPEAMIPELNALGADGWELLHMQPVVVGKNSDVLIADNGSGGRSWASQYFCVFKRPVD